MHPILLALGMALPLVVYALIPAAVLSAFESVSAWRHVTIKWWLQVLVMVAVGAALVLFLER